MNAAIQQEDNRKKNGIAMLYTLLIAGGIFAILFIIRLHHPDPLPTVKEIELELGFGNPDAGGGGGGSSAMASNNQPSTPAEANPSNPMETNEDDPKVNIPPVNKPNTPPNNTPPKNPGATTKPNNTSKPLNPNASFPGMSGNGDGDGNGNGSGSGNGNGTGNGSGGGNGTGNGSGTGPGNKPGVVGDGDFVLEGRSMVSRPKIEEDIFEEGKVVVDIWVDQNGAVTRVSVNAAQTNTNSKKLRDIALKNAKKIKFSPNPNAAVEQKGLYIYKFILH